MADDEVTTELKRIREQREWTAMPRLVAALEAALAHHVEAVIEDMPVPRFRYCSTCSGHPAWPCPEVGAITAALAGKEACPACRHKAHPETPAECPWCPEGYCEQQKWPWPEPPPPGFIVPKPTPFRPAAGTGKGGGDG